MRSTNKKRTVCLKRNGKTTKEGQRRKEAASLRATDAFTIHGRLFGLRVEPRTKERSGTDSPLVHVLIEDDGNWIAKNVVFDAYWLDDLISTAKSLRERLAP